MFPKLCSAILALSAAALGTQAASELIVDEGFQPVLTRPAGPYASSPDAAGNIAIYGNVHAINGTPVDRLTKIRKDGTLDQTFRPAVMPRCDYLGFESAFSVFLREDGKVLRDECESTPPGFFDHDFFVRQLNADGAPDPGFIPFLHEGPEMRFYSGGGERVLAYGHSFLGRLNNDGTFDPGFADLPPFYAGVAPSAMPDGRLFIWSDLTIDDTNYWGVVRLLPSGRWDPAFRPVATSTNLALTFPQAMAALPDGGALVSYQRFSAATNPNPENPAPIIEGGLIRYHNDGTQDETFYVEQNRPVTSISLQADGRIIIAGNFTQVNGMPRLRIARLHVNGSVDTTFQPDAAADAEPVYLGGAFSAKMFYDVVTGSYYTNSFPDPLSRIRVQTDGKILVRGTSDRGGWLMRFNEDGSLDQSYRPNVEVSGLVNHLLVQRDGRCVIWDTNFTEAVRAISLPFASRLPWLFVNGQARPGLVRINTNGTADATFATNFPSAQGGNIQGMVEAADRSILLWGRFTNVAGITQCDLLRLSPNGQVESGFQANVQPFNSLTGVLPRADGTIVIWGSFSNVNSRAIHGVARLLSNGLLDETFSPRAEGVVVGLWIDASNRLSLWGAFPLANGGGSNYLVRLDANGQPDPAFHPANVNDLIVNLIPASDGGYYLRGAFTQVDGTPRQNLAKLAPDGSLDTTFNPTFSIFEYPTASRGLRELEDGKLVVWGDLRLYPPLSRRKIIRLSKNGSLDATPFSLDSFLTFNGVRDVLPDRGGGAIIIPGSLDPYPVGTNNYWTAAYLRADGTVSFDLPVMTNDPDEAFITQAAWDAQGRLVVAGKFARVAGRPRFGLARYLRTPRLENAAYSIAQGFHATVFTYPGESFRLERSANLLDWIPAGTFTATNQETTVTDSAVIGVPAQFYRVVSMSP